jgi:hypothetical protein
LRLYPLRFGYTLPGSILESRGGSLLSLLRGGP